MVNRTIVYVAIAGAVGIGLALGSYYMIKAMARKPEEEKVKEKVKEIPEEVGAPTISTDKDVYEQTEFIKWEARNLEVGRKYAVMVFETKQGVYLYAPSRDVFTARRSVERGLFQVGYNISPGKHRFVLFEYTDSKERREVDSVSITVRAKASALTPSLFFSYG
jgi:hypothetical protein